MKHFLPIVLVLALAYGQECPLNATSMACFEEAIQSHHGGLMAQILRIVDLGKVLPFFLGGGSSSSSHIRSHIGQLSHLDVAKKWKGSSKEFQDSVVQFLEEHLEMLDGCGAALFDILAARCDDSAGDIESLDCFCLNLGTSFNLTVDDNLPKGCFLDHYLCPDESVVQAVDAFGDLVHCFVTPTSE